MHKFAAMGGAALIALGTGPLTAHEREAHLQKITGPDNAFDMIVATAKSPNAPIYDLSETPDALVIHLIGGELWLAFEDAAKMLEAIDVLHRPIGAFRVGNQDNAVAVYIAPKRPHTHTLAR